MFRQERCDGVLFVERTGELISAARLRRAERWSRRETESEQGVELLGLDPKPGELPMARVKRR
jgi:hypothetical protein